MPGKPWRSHWSDELVTGSDEPVTVGDEPVTGSDELVDW